MQVHDPESPVMGYALRDPVSVGTFPSPAESRSRGKAKVGVITSYYLLIYLLLPPATSCHLMKPPSIYWSIYWSILPGGQGEVKVFRRLPGDRRQPQLQVQ